MRNLRVLLLPYVLCVAVPAAASSISGFSPTSGVAGTTVTISGSDFTFSTGVQFNGVAASSFTVNSNSSITAVVALGTTTGKIAVINPIFGNATSAGNYTIPAPSITSFAPHKVVTDITVTILGLNFVDTTNVAFAGSNAHFRVISNTELQADVPPGAPASGTVRVFTRGGDVTSASSYQVVPGLLANPDFENDVAGWTTCAQASCQSELTWETQGDSSPGALKLAPADLNAFAHQCAAVTPATRYVFGARVRVPTISTLSGTRVKLQLAWYSDARCQTSANIVDQTATVVSPSQTDWFATAVAAPAPAGAVSARAILFVDTATRFDSVGYVALFDRLFLDVERAPAIVTFNPPSGPAGTTVTIEGTDLYGVSSSLLFNGVPASSVDVLSSTRVRAVVPATATSGPIAYSTQAGTATSATSFGVPPQITSFSHSVMPVGFGFVVYGSGLTNILSVRINGLNAPFAGGLSGPGQQITVYVPAGATTGPVTVETPWGTATSPSPLVIWRDGDVSHDGKGDIIVEHPNGTVSAWLMNGATVTATTSIGTLPPGAHIEAADNLWAYGEDLILRDSADGLGIWDLFGTAVIAGHYIAPAGGYRVVGVGNFGDLELHHVVVADASGKIGSYVLHALEFQRAVPIAAVGSSYQVAAVADFNNDRVDELLLTGSNGDVGMWMMSDASITGGALVGTAPGYAVAGVNDFNADGRADILLRDSHGNLGLWFMNGATITSGAYVGSPGPDYSVVLVKDFNGDAKSDILFQHTNGGLGMWLMNGATPTGGGFVGTVTAGTKLY